MSDSDSLECAENHHDGARARASRRSAGSRGKSMRFLRGKLRGIDAMSLTRSISSASTPAASSAPTSPESSVSGAWPGSRDAEDRLAAVEQQHAAAVEALKEQAEQLAWLRESEMRGRAARERLEADLAKLRDEARYNLQYLWYCLACVVVFAVLSSSYSLERDSLAIRNHALLGAIYVGCALAAGLVLQRRGASDDAGQQPLLPPPPPLPPVTKPRAPSGTLRPQSMLPEPVARRRPSLATSDGEGFEPMASSSNVASLVSPVVGPHSRRRHHHHHHHHTLSHNTGAAGAADCPSHVLEYGISENGWLNFFEGMDVPIDALACYREMTEAQKEIYREFRHNFRSRLGACPEIDRLKPYTLPDDAAVLRFLQADGFDTALAMKRLIKTVAWRQEIDLPRLVHEPPECLELYRSLRVRRCMGFDKSGRPVFAERIGAFVGALGSAKARSITQQEYLRCYIYDMGQFISKFREAAQLGHATWKFTFIADCRGVKFLQAAKSINLLKSFAKEVEVHFPEQAGPIFVVNCPSVVASLWKVAKQFLDPTVINKIQIHQGVPTEALLEQIDRDVLFTEYGGNNAAPFPSAAKA